MILLLLACGMSEGRFERVALKRWCLQSNNCDAAVDVDTCIATLRDQDRSGCVFDPVAGQACHDALTDVVCMDAGVEVRVLDVPPACAEVWTCEEAG